MLSAFAATRPRRPPRASRTCRCSRILRATASGSTGPSPLANRSCQRLFPARFLLLHRDESSTANVRGRPPAVERPFLAPPPAGKARDDRRRQEDRQSKGKIVVRLRVARRHEVRDPGGLQRHPGVESRDRRAERGQAGNAAVAPRRLQRGGSGSAKLRYGPLHAPRGRKRTLRPRQTALRRQRLPERRGAGPETGVQRHTAFQGFEADRGACGALKHRCPVAASDCAGRKECYRTAPGWRVWLSALDKHDRRLFTPTPWGSLSWKRGSPFRRGSIAGSATPTEKHYRRRLRLGLMTVVATALGCLRAERRDGFWLAWSGCATDRRGRPTTPETGCLRPRPGLSRVCGAAPQQPDIFPLF